MRAAQNLSGLNWEERGYWIVSQSTADVVIDQEDWSKFKRKEKQELETIQEPVNIVEEENGVEIVEMLDAEHELGKIESKHKFETKRKTKNDGKPPAKMKKLENLMMMMLERILGLIRKMIRKLLSKKSADGW